MFNKQELWSIDITIIIKFALLFAVGPERVFLHGGRLRYVKHVFSPELFWAPLVWVMCSNTEKAFQTLEGKKAIKNGADEIMQIRFVSCKWKSLNAPKGQTSVLILSWINKYYTLLERNNTKYQSCPLLCCCLHSPWDVHALWFLMQPMESWNPISILLCNTQTVEAVAHSVYFTLPLLPPNSVGWWELASGSRTSGCPLTAPRLHAATCAR